VSAASLGLLDASQVWSVSDLATAVKEALNELFPAVAVEGELSGVRRYPSGHWYFSIKDESACLSAVMWRSTAAKLKFEPTDGLHVIALAEPDLYGARGQFQLIVQKMTPLRVGALELAFRQLQEKLTREGLFAPERKRPIPTYPRRVVVVTSAAGAALRDFLEVAGRRWRGAEIILIPCLVQGDGAPTEIVAALRRAPMLEPNVIALIRGGGSAEDLWAFNDETVARTIAACPIPIVAGIGHEVDVTIADLVADLRALTPSEAAEHIFPDAAAIAHRLKEAEKRLAGGVLDFIARRWQTLQMYAQSAALREPARLLRTYEEKTASLEASLSKAVRKHLEDARCKLEAPEGFLKALNPNRVLERGYAIATDEFGNIVRRAGDLNPGQLLRLQLAEGVVKVKVEHGEEN
jgi:exodeoxyribonuclease VII large subunit